MEKFPLSIGILVGPGYEDLEFWVPYMRMLEEGAEVNVIATSGGEIYNSKSGGLTVESQVAAKDITADLLDALLVPGGWAPDKLRRAIKEGYNPGRQTGWMRRHDYGAEQQHGPRHIQDIGRQMFSK